MEYHDFLSYWEGVEKTQIFDGTWVQSSHWLNVQSRPLESAWQYGDVSCMYHRILIYTIMVLILPLVTFTIPQTTDVVLVLSQSDTRFYRSVRSAAEWSFDFKLFKVGSPELLGSSNYSYGMTRSTNLRVKLNPGDYIVHVRSLHISASVPAVLIREIYPGTIEQESKP